MERPLASPIKIGLVSCGLGRVSRGFESTTANWYEILNKGIPDTQVRLFAGGAASGGVQVANFPRNGRLCRFLRRLRLIHDGCRLEQMSFALGLIPHLLRWRPDVLWLQEITLGKWLLWLRRPLGLNYRLVFCDGAPVGATAYKNFDFVQVLTPEFREEGIAAGIEPERVAVFPHPILECPPVTVQDRFAARLALNLPASAFVVLSVAAWNRHHKRIDYVVREVASMKGPGVHLLLCGQAEAETPGIKAEAAVLLGDRCHWHTLPYERMAQAYAAADTFVLASLHEAFGLVLLEAVAAGLPTLAHPHPAARFILEREPWLCDLSMPGGLAEALRLSRERPDTGVQARTLRARVMGRFGDQILAPQFVALLRSARAMPLKGTP